MLYDKIKKYLKNNNINIENVAHLIELQDNSDGKGAFIKRWNIEWVAQPTKTQLEAITEEEIVLDRVKETKINQCKKYLNDTGWQIERLCDPSSGAPLKEGVAEKRALARSLQDDIDACTTLEELNAININLE